MKTKLYPKSLYVFRENEGTDDEYMNVTQTADELAVIGERRSVGFYILQEVVTVQGIVAVESKSK